MDKKIILRKFPLFEHLSSKSLDQVAGICLQHQAAKKELLFLEGDKGYSLYILVQGSIQLYKTGPDGKEVAIKTVKPGELFAEVVLFGDNTYPVTAVTLTDSTLYMLPKHQFSCLLENPEFRKDFIVNLLDKMKFLTDQMKYLTQYDVEDRLFLFLKEQYPGEETIHTKLSKKDIATAVGTTPETLSRVLLRLKQDGRLIWEGNTITLKNPKSQAPNNK
ncbi:MAG: Crp/Fnr family transcriptional regulator [bacterium]